MKVTRALSLSLHALCFGAALVVAACADDPATPAPSEVGPGDDDDSANEGGKKDAGKDAAPKPADDDKGDDDKPATAADAGKPRPTIDAGKGTTVDPSSTPDAGKPSTPVTNPNGPPPAAGPDDGDPSKPVVTIPDAKCGSAAGFGLGTANLKIGGRDVILTYPCDKHEGANVTFILLLHGTNSNEASKTYTHGYFAAHALTSSHNLIIAEPKSRASQWGNTTENPAASEDKPHLLEVIDFVYKNFGTKFKINSLWVAGHSWGAMYAKRFVCDETIKDKARGVIGMSGGTTLPGGRGFGTSGSDLTPTTNCADYIAQIHTVGDMDMVTGLPDQTAAATKHGCDAKLPAVDLGSMQMVEEWPNCDPGFVHEGVTMGAHMHTTAINAPVVKHVIEKVKATEKR
jgi:hypothetical protein